MDFKILLVLYAIMESSKVNAYSQGAPASTCLTMFPKHRHKEAQTKQSPFIIELSVTRYIPGQVINITLTSVDQRPFRGIQIRAHRESGDTEEILGTFLTYPESKTKAFNCLGGKQNLITHKTNERVTNISLTWQAPNVNVGNIVFVATFVESYEIFWANVKTTLQSSSQITQPPIEQVSLSDTALNFDECGKTMGCFLYPKYCTGSNCDAGMTYKTDNDNVTIQLFGKGEGYISVGFSHDRHMGADQTISCTAENDRVTIQHGFNPALFNFRQTVSGRLTNMHTKKIDGTIFCSFTRPKAMEVYDYKAPNGTTVFDLNNDYYVMVAWGYTYEGTDVMGKHEELPATTLYKVNFNEYVIHRGKALPVLTQIHGILMIIAWVFFAGITTIVSRYYKTAMDKLIYGSKLWFQVHRAAALTTFIITAASFILIFVKVDGLTNDAEIHAYVGIAVMSATVLQILGGLLRPNPKHKIRPAFNWLHWLLGKTSHLLSALALFFAFNAPIIPASQKLFGTISIGVWLGLQILWEIIFEIRKCRNSGGKSDKYNITTVNDDSTTSDVSTGDKVCFSLYIISMMCMLALSAMSIFFF